MGTGLDHTDPAIHRQVRTQIERTGLVFTPQVAFQARWDKGVCGWGKVSDVSTYVVVLHRFGEAVVGCGVCFIGVL